MLMGWAQYRGMNVSQPRERQEEREMGEEKLVLVRTVGAGVHVGRLVRVDGITVELKDASRIWRWRGAHTLHELATTGASAEYTRISVRVPAITLLHGTEIIPVTATASATLQPPWG